MTTHIAAQLNWLLRPIQPLLDDPRVTDLHINGPNLDGITTNVFVKRGAVRSMETVNLRLRDLENIGDNAAALMRQDIAEDMPFCSTKLPQGQRLQLVRTPALPDGRYAMAIRRPTQKAATIEELVNYKLFSEVRTAEVVRTQPRKVITDMLELKAAGQWPELIQMAIRNGLNVIWCGLVGTGKAQPDHSPVLTPTGFRPIGSLSVGDVVVCPDGKHAPITGVYPQGEKEIYRITFDDGRTTECCDDHLWRVWRHGKWIVIPTSKMRMHLANARRVDSEPCIQLVEPCAIEQVPQDLPVPPYALGALLGDGTLPQLSGICLTTADSFILEKVMAEIPEMEAIAKGDSGYDFRLVQKVRHQRGGLRFHIKQLGLRGCRSHEKFIPEIYKRGSVSQRLAVLQGLMDTDGSIDAKTGVSGTFSSTSERLANDVREVAWSLGAICTLRERQTFFTGSCGTRKAGKPSWRVTIVHPDIAQMVSLPRKLALCKRKTMRHNLHVKKIEPIGVAFARCIAVDHPDHLYVTDDYIVTHNTHSMRGFLESIPLDRRLVTVEDMEEIINLQHPNVVNLLYPKGRGQSVSNHTAEDCIEAALRLDMDMLLCQEVRDAAAWSYLRALNSGHPGMTSCHAGSAEGAFKSIGLMVRQHESGKTLDNADLQAVLRELIHVVCYCEDIDGRKRVTQVYFEPEMQKGMPQQAAYALAAE